MLATAGALRHSVGDQAAPGPRAPRAPAPGPSSRSPHSCEHLLQVTRVREGVFDRNVDTQVLRLRRKRGACAPRIIRMERGFGYVFALSVETSDNSTLPDRC